MLDAAENNVPAAEAEAAAATLEPQDKNLQNNLAVQTDGTVQLNFTGTPGYVYMIEAAMNLTPPIAWTMLSTNAADTNGVFSFIDDNATNYNDRYNRTEAQAP